MNGSCRTKRMEVGNEADNALFFVSIVSECFCCTKDAQGPLKRYCLPHLERYCKGREEMLIWVLNLGPFRKAARRHRLLGHRMRSAPARLLHSPGCASRGYSCAG